MVQPRRLHVVLPAALVVLALACTTPTATTPDATAEADAAPDVLAEVAAPDVAVVDVADVADAVDVAADVSVAGLVVQSSEATLIPPPLTVAFSATKDGVDMSAECSWTVGPSSVCVLADASHVRKVADGTCVVTCALASGETASKELVAKAQTVIYAVGGITVMSKSSAQNTPKNLLRISRYRVDDDEWDATVAMLPETKAFPAVGIWKHHLYVVGGADAMGKIASGQSHPVPPAKDACPEYVMNGGDDGGCRTVRILDLDTGKWTNGGELPTAWSVDAATQVDSTMLLAGGANFYGDASRMHRYDMASQVWTDLSAFAPSKETYLVANWKSAFIAFSSQAAGKIWEVDVGGQNWTPMTLPNWTFSSPTVAFAGDGVGASDADLLLLVDNSITKSDFTVLPGGCALASATGASCNFARLNGGVWSLLSAPPTLLDFGAMTSVATATGLFIVAKNSCPPGGSGHPAWYLPHASGTWTPVADAPYCRTYAGYATTIQ